MNKMNSIFTTLTLVVIRCCRCASLSMAVDLAVGIEAGRSMSTFVNR